MSETCDRCQSIGEDRRTLWMACFYAMDELPIPFGEAVLFDVDLAECTPAKEPLRIDLTDGPSIVLAAGTVRCSGELRPLRLYTLRVCKRCRGEWMGAIRDWYLAVPKGDDDDEAPHA